MSSTIFKFQETSVTRHLYFHSFQSLMAGSRGGRRLANAARLVVKDGRLELAHAPIRRLPEGENVVRGRTVREKDAKWADAPKVIVFLIVLTTVEEAILGPHLQPIVIYISLDTIEFSCVNNRIDLLPTV